MSEKMFSILMEAILIIMCLFISGRTCIILAKRSIASWRKYKASRNWPITNGEVIAAELKVTENADGDRCFRPHVIYHFQVNEHSVLAERISLGIEDLFVLKQKAHQVLKRYPVGKQLQVRYNPNNPKEAALEAVNRSWPSLIYSMLLMAAIGYLLYFLMITLMPILLNN